MTKFGLAAGALMMLSIGAWAQGDAASAASGNMSVASSAGASGSAQAPTGKKADRALRRQVYAAISKKKDISAGSIGVTARNGAVTLTGTVPDAAQIDRVVELAKGVPGVVSVTSKLTTEKPFQ
ncbi:BON domain-containing protein [Burkholderia sp. D-99]|nr:BON domain-containing protein [Burkholderia sp. D-99]